MHDDAVYQAIETFWQHHALRSSRICVAVSGGSDSVALLHLLSTFRKRLSIKNLGIAHVNHRLRGVESDGDARFVASLAKRIDAPFHCIRLLKREVPASGIEEWARNNRYAFFAKVMNQYGYDFVATAHTADDQAETVLLRLLRGTGIRGLAGIVPVREDRIIRPLLSVRKEQLTDWVKDHDLAFRLDSSNGNIRFTRNWLRLQLLPQMSQEEPDCVRLLVRVAEKALATETVMETILNKWKNSYVVQSGQDSFTVNKKGLFNSCLWDEGISSLLRENKVGPKRIHIESIIVNRNKNGKTFLLPSGWRYRVGRQTIEFFHRENGIGLFSQNLAMGGTTRNNEQGYAITVEKQSRQARTAISFSDPMTALIDAEKVDGPLFFRSITPHEKFWPFGWKRQTDVADFLKKQKYTRHERKHIGVVSMKNGEILWIVGLRIGHRFRILPQTREFIKISYEKVC